MTLHSNFQTLLQHFQKKTWYWPFCIEYENNMISHYIKEVHAIKWCIKIISIPIKMHLIIIQLQRQSPPVDFQVSKILAQSTISIGRPHNDTCIKAFNVSSFNWLMWSLLIQFCLKNPRSHKVVFVRIMSVHYYNFIIVGQFYMNSWSVPQHNHVSCIHFRLHTFIKDPTNSNISPLYRYAMS